MPILKYYNPSTSQWEPVVVGKQGPQGIQGIQGETGYGAVNTIINGAFDIWQRGTSFASISSGSYSSDRWQVVFDGTGVRTVSQQTFPTGQAPVAGYEGTFFYRYNQTTAGSGATFGGIQQRVEDVRTLAGQNVTLSFWAKADTNRTLLPFLDQNFGSGGSTNSSIALGSASLTTSWQRFTMTIALPGLSGKTIGTSSFLQLYFGVPNNVLQTIDIWGVQLEAGSTATPFRRNANSLAGELAACQRYFQIQDFSVGHTGVAGVDVNGRSEGSIAPTVTMRVAPSCVTSGSWFYDGNSSGSVTGQLSFFVGTRANGPFNLFGSPGPSSGLCAFTGGSITLSAEL
jgi:hypothetical protein